ncbi:pilin N-terminal domain-containing protein [Anaerococcus lactolyticus]|uniref:pilin N-terminal domain-containing protein n=1 Tax=Anaerococcus lactolyticus TaxID=33032 RepID=UPI00288A0841|nr:pilin N-terminal domain-containing protein [Anaerococcus lactolyticus]
MKHKILSFLTAFAMVFGIIAAPFVNASAADNKTSDKPDAVTKTVTLHKLMMTKDELKAWDYKKVEEEGYNGTQDLAVLKTILGATHSAKEADNIFFAWQVKGKETNASGAKQYIKKADDSTAELVKPAIGASGEVEFTTNIDEAFGGKTANKSGIKFDTSAFKKTETYLIQEIKEKSTYKNDGNVIVDQKAVPVEITLPLVNADGTVIDAHVYPKNTEDKPKIDKNFKKADTEKQEKELEKADGFEEAADGAGIGVGADVENYTKKKATAKAEVGKKIPYEVKTKIAAGTSYENLTWNDIMTNGLTYNKDLKVTADNGITFAETDYKLVQDNTGFRLQLTPAGLKKIEGKTKDTANPADVTITIQYSATVNGTAVVDNPEENNVTLEYGHKPGKDLEEKPVKPKNGDLTVTKKFGENKNTDGLKLVYTLKNGNEVVASVALDNTIKNKTINLGNGITFEVGDTPFNGTFKGLDQTKTTDWTISERVAGYNPEYTETNNDGTVTITNKKDNDNPPPLEPSVQKVVVGGKKFVKTTDKDADKVQAADRLAGAKFVVKKGTQYLAVKSVDTVESEKKKLAEAKKALDNAVEQYNNRADDTSKNDLIEAIKTAQDSYNEAFKTAGTRYEWVNSKAEQGKTIVTLVSNKDGQFEIEGLEYGSYKLEEIEAPKGYAKKNDVDFTIAKGDKTDVEIKYTGTENVNNAKQVINKTVTIPQTGGIGSIIFVVAGLMIMGLAGYKMKANKEQA